MNETTNPEKLFKEWAQLEPDRCREHAEMFDLRVGNNWSSAFSLVISPAPSDTGWGVVQVAVQEAIHARRWRLRVADVSVWHNDLDGERDSRSYRVDLMNSQFVYQVGANYENPAAGLLCCYLWALRRGDRSD